MNLLSKGFTSAALAAAGFAATASPGLAQTIRTSTTAASGSAGTTSSSAVGTPTKFGTGVHTATGARFHPGGRSTVIVAPSDRPRFDGDLSQLRGDDSQLSGDDSQFRTGDDSQFRTGDDSQFRTGDDQSSNNNGNVQSVTGGVTTTGADIFSLPAGLTGLPQNQGDVPDGLPVAPRGGLTPNELGRTRVPNRMGRGGLRVTEVGRGAVDPDGPDGPVQTDVNIRQTTPLGRAATAAGLNPLATNGVVVPTNGVILNGVNGVIINGGTLRNGGGFQRGDEAATFGGRSPAPSANVHKATVFGRDNGPNTGGTPFP